jgi:hypothetical protein
MKQLVKKISKPIALKIRLILGSIFMGIAMFILPVFLLITNPPALADPTVIGVSAAIMIVFGLIGYFAYVRPFILFGKLPAVLVEADGEFLYIHSKKEVKIPLAELTNADVYVDLPYDDQPSALKDFMDDILVHYCAERYGTLILELDGFGKYKLYFVSQVQKTSDELIAFLDKAMNG